MVSFFDEVSILVLMDLSFLQIEDSYYNINGYVSILVLIDLSFLQSCK